MHAAPAEVLIAQKIVVRPATSGDLESIRCIYNEGIEDRIATLDSDAKSSDEIAQWWSAHGGRFSILIATNGERVIGWASLNPFTGRCAHADVADLSVYVARDLRGSGVGFALLKSLIADAAVEGFHKVVLHALDFNEHGKRLYRKAGFVEVGVFKEHGLIDGRYADVIAMERLLA
jgi:phosphinothricin acetyltransferase